MFYLHILPTYYACILYITSLIYYIRKQKNVI